MLTAIGNLTLSGSRMVRSKINGEKSCSLASVPKAAIEGYLQSTNATVSSNIHFRKSIGKRRSAGV